MRRVLILFLFFASGLSLSVRAQTPLLQQQLLQLTSRSDSLINHYPSEKIYIQFDKPEYTLGDTIWFKAYVFNAASHLLSSRSGLLHVDIATDSNRVVKQYLFAVTSGLSPGNLVLNTKDYKSGNYVIRAYTQWMRNFSEDGFFYKQLRIADADEKGWLVKSRIDTSNQGRHLRSRLAVSRLDQVPMTDSTFLAEVYNGKKQLYKQTVHAGANGLLDLAFELPADAKPSIRLESKDKSKRAVVPVGLNRPQNTDVQFMPEGGGVVAGLASRIGFKAIGEDGRGVSITGIVVDKEGKPAAELKSFYRGMGVFTLLPQPSQQYTARITLPGGTIKNYALPEAKASGIVLRVNNEFNSDSLQVELFASPDLQQSGQSWFLLGKDRGVVCYAAVFDFGKSLHISKMISKVHFPTGIAHFMVLSQSGQPLAERLVYIDQKDELQIHIEPGKAQYTSKDSIALHLMVTDHNNQPVQGVFSMAVTDDLQVKTDSLNDENLLSKILITSDLKGYVETPAYYLKHDEPNWQALDDLLLTQGWVNYEPQSTSLHYTAETEYKVSGIVSNLFNAPVKKTEIMLFSSHPSVLMDTITDDKGQFLFHRFPRLDTPVFVLQARNRHGKSFNVNIKVDEVFPPVFKAPYMPEKTPWYVNTDTTLGMRLKNIITFNKFLDSIPGVKAHHLKEVKIIAKKVVKGSENLNGPGNADVVLDEKDMEAAGKKNLLQLLEENIKGFHYAWFKTPERKASSLSPAEHEDAYTFETNEIRHAPESNWYFVFEKPLILIMDGIQVSDEIPNFRFDDYKALLENVSAEDVKGIELNFNPRFSGNYLKHGIWMEEPIAEFKIRDFAFIEITTRSGHGANTTFTPGTYLYNPLALTWPKRFYKPRYTLRDTAKNFDPRATIDWEPQIITDASGKATVTFYAGTSPSSYTVIMEGADLNGDIGSERKKIVFVMQKDGAKSK